MLDVMRPKSQLALKDSAVAKPSALPDFLIELKKNTSVSGYHTIPARDPALVDFPSDIDPRLREVLTGRGVARLYSHQAEAFKIARKRENAVIVTPTASGKTLCYNLPVLQRILENPDAHALYLHPTKALTYDQLDDLREWADALAITNIGVYYYDGDTPKDARPAVRSRGHIILSNPDLL